MAFNELLVDNDFDRYHLSNLILVYFNKDMETRQTRIGK